ncbi:MAG: S41 family peptidase [Planctomycetota bacterium]
MNPPVVRLFAVALTLALSLPGQKALAEGPAVSPFRGMRMSGDTLEVQVADDTWSELLAVGACDTATLLREAKRLCGPQAWKRITEDLPALLGAMGQPVGDKVDLKVRDLASNEVKELPGVALTAANRRRLWEANKGGRAPDLEAVQVALTNADARADLQTLRTLLDTQFAYRELRPVDLDKLLRDAEARLGDAQTVGMATFVASVDRVLCAFGDGHSRIDAQGAAVTAFLPFLVQQVDGGHAVFQPSREALVDAGFPFLVAIDGVPLAKWLDAARARGTQGSAAMQARLAERGLRDLALLRQDLQLPAEQRVQFTLRGPGGERELDAEVASRRPTYGAWPRTETRVLDGDVGYLRIPEMSGDAGFLDGLDSAMQAFRDTKGLVIDVRGNGGGTRDALRRLAPYLLPANGAPVVGNVAAVLLDRGQAAPADALSDRGLYRVDWNGWTDAQRGAITQFARAWKPSWKLPAGKFSPWHFLVLDRADNPKAFAYGQKVVLLIDRGCFSATDVFAAALQALPNVTLVGEATSGGSGRARSQVLPKSGVRLQLSTMASFRPDGVLFEGNGVVPDVVVAMQPTDLVGATDTALAVAMARLR